MKLFKIKNDDTKIRLTVLGIEITYDKKLPPRSRILLSAKLSLKCIVDRKIIIFIRCMDFIGEKTEARFASYLFSLPIRHICATENDTNFEMLEVSRVMFSSVGIHFFNIKTFDRNYFNIIYPNGVV